MLGNLIGRRPWSWAAFGKHPSARDYFQIKLEKPLAQAFSQWVENGFGRLPETVRRNGVYSWRFWSRGLKKGSLVCGLGKSSGDGVGRPYPLVLIGEGQLERWEKNWSLLPFVLAPVWDKMEYTASRRLEDIGQLEADLQRMENPIPSWKETLRMFPNPESPQAESIHKLVMEQIQTKARTLETEHKLTIPLDQDVLGDSLQMAGAWHQALRTQLALMPSTVFMGGSLEKAYLVLFLRPLVADDFIELWSV